MEIFYSVFCALLFGTLLALAALVVWGVPMTCLSTGWFVVFVRARSALAGRYIAEAVNPEPTVSDERRQAGHERVHCKKKGESQSLQR
jgi:hypothetical protein